MTYVQCTKVTSIETSTSISIEYSYVIIVNSISSRWH